MLRIGHFYLAIADRNSSLDKVTFRAIIVKIFKGEYKEAFLFYFLFEIVKILTNND